MRALKAYLAGLSLGLLPAVLTAQPPQYGYIPPYATADLPTCDAAHANRIVFDSTAGEYRPYCSQTATTGAASSYEHGAIDTSSAATECSITTNNPTGGVASGTTAGPSATLTHSVTQPSNHTFTQPSFAGTQFGNRPAFAKVIFCRRT